MFEKIKKKLNVDNNINYYSALFACAYPFAITIIFAFFLVFNYRRNFKWTHAFEKLIVTFSFTFYSTQTNIFNSLFRILDCKNIEGSLFMKNHLSEACSGKRYLSWIFYLVIPNFGFYAFCLPFFCFTYMFINQKRLTHKDVIRKIGFIGTGFGNDKFYWYLNILLFCNYMFFLKIGSLYFFIENF